MGHESRIELWSPNLTTFCFVGFGTDRLRCEEAMKTAGRENPIHGVAWPRNRAHGAADQNRSHSIKWAANQEKFQPKELCFFLTSPFRERGRMAPQPSTWRGRSEQISLDQVGCESRKIPAEGVVFFLDFSFYRTGSHGPATEHMARQVRTDLARSSGLRSKKNSSRRSCVFS